MRVLLDDLSDIYADLDTPEVLLFEEGALEVAFAVALRTEAASIPVLVTHGDVRSASLLLKNAAPGSVFFYQAPWITYVEDKLLRESRPLSVILIVVSAQYLEGFSFELACFHAPHVDLARSRWPQGYGPELETPEDQ